MGNLIRVSWLLFACVALAAGCSDEGATGNGLQGGGPDFSLGRDATVLDTGLLPGGDGGNQGQGGAAGAGAGGSGGMAGGAGGGECRPFDRRCPESGAAYVEVCSAEGRWVSEPCADDELCVNANCIPDPVGCEPGTTVCLAPSQPALCQADQWQPTDPCGANEVCYDGECYSRNCLTAAQRSSYLGCDYLAVDFPNVVNDSNSPEFFDAPVGIVIANPSQVDAVRITVRDPLGDIANLQAEKRVVVPDLELDQDGDGFNESRLSDVAVETTVYSRVRDAQGMVVQDRIAQANGVELPPGGTATFLLPRQMGPINTSSLRRDAFRVITDNPVVAYQFSPYCCNYTFSNDASLLLPTTALGTRYVFLGTPTFTQGLLPPQLAVVAPEDDTQVTVRLPDGIDIVPDFTNPNLRSQGGQVQVTMNAQDVLLLSPSSLDFFTPADMSGADIQSTKAVAVFSSHPCNFYPDTVGACDHLEEQLIPVSTWGTGFQLVPPKERGNNWFQEVIYWKMVARSANTRVRFSVPFNQLRASQPGAMGVPYCGQFVQGDELVLGEGQFCEFGTKTPVAVNASAPISIMGIMVGQGATGLGNGYNLHAGDPAIFLVPPDRQFRREYVFLTPDTYFSDYVTVVTQRGNQLQLDGAAVNLADASSVVGSDAIYKHIELPRDGPHRIQGQQPFGILVYAYDDYVSYAFTGGLNLTKQ